MSKASCKVAGIPREPIFEGNFSFNVGTVRTMSTLDYTIALLTLAASASIGIYIAWESRRRQSIDEFLLVGRKLPAFPAGLSLTASFISGITVIGIPRSVYTYSTMEIFFALAGVFAVATSSTVFMPVFFQLKVTSAYEYLGKRFSRRVRVVGSTYFVFMTMVFLSMVLYAPSLSLSAVTGFSLWGSILSVGILCIFYTALGGMKAVIYTDAFQLMVTISGLLAMLIKGSMTVGGFSEMIESTTRTNRLIINWQLDPRDDQTFWAVMIGGYFYLLATYGINQQQLHRCLCCSTQEEATRAMWISIPFFWILMIASTLIGLFLSSFYENCDPESAGLIESPGQLVPLFVMDAMSDVNGLPGLFVAALFCATLSSVSSGLNSVAAVTLEDWVRPYFKTNIKEGCARFMIQVITVIVGLVCLEITAFAIGLDGGQWQIDMAINGSLATPLLGVFMLGMFLPLANERGALWGVLSGTLFNIIVFTAKNGVENVDQEVAATCVSNCNLTVFSNSTVLLLTRPATTPIPQQAEDTNFLLSLSSRYYGMLGMFVTIIVGMIVSYATGFTDPLTVEPVLIVPVCDVLFPFYYLPENFRKKLRFGIDHTDKWKKWHTLLESKSQELAQERKDREVSDMAMIASSRDIFGPDIHFAAQNARHRSFDSGSKESEV